MQKINIFTFSLCDENVKRCLQQGINMLEWVNMKCISLALKVLQTIGELNEYWAYYFKRQWYGFIK